MKRLFLYLAVPDKLHDVLPGWFAKDKKAGFFVCL